MNKPQAFIFDLDGVIADTAKYHYHAWKNLAESLDIEIDEVFNDQLKGVGRLESLELILEKGELQNKFSAEQKVALAKKKNIQYVQMIAGISPNDTLPGIIGLIEEIRGQGIKVGLASASNNAPAILTALKITDKFDYIANPQKVGKSKPAPDLFLDVANALQVDHSQCVGIEDAQVGVTAINSAGMYSVGVGDPDELSASHLLYQNTAQLDYSTIVREFSLALEK